MSSTITPGMHPVLGALRVVDAGLDELGQANLWALSDGESLEVRAELERLNSRLAAARLAATREVETRGAAVKAGASSTRAWLVNRVHLHPGEATRELILGAQLDQDLPATAGLAGGEITAAAANVIAETDAALRRFATAAERGDAEAFLAGQAQLLTLRHLQNAALHLRHRLDPDQGARLAKEEDKQVAGRELRIRLNPDGSSRLQGYLDKEATALLRTALDPLAKPRPAADGIPDPRSPAQRTGDALVELVELALRCGNLPSQAGQPVQLVITIPLSDLQTHPAGPDNTAGHPGARTSAGAGAGVGAGVLDYGIPLSAEATRRLACDCQLIPVVLGAHGEPLDVGRASREPTPAIRRALEVRDQGCAFPGCDRPPRWCISHHIWHWEAGGPTAITNLVLLCGHHHRAIHHHGWDVRIEADGLPSFYPPAWIDPDRTPRRNHRHTPHPTPAAAPGQPRDGHTPVIPFPRRN